MSKLKNRTPRSHPMFNEDIKPLIDFSEREKFNQQLNELKQVVTNLEFRREEMHAAMDSLTQTLNSFALISNQVVNK